MKKSGQIIKVRVNAGAKTEKIEEVAPRLFRVRVQTPPEKGRANKRVIALVAEYLDIPASRISLISGATYKEKLLVIKS